MRICARGCADARLCVRVYADQLAREGVCRPIGARGRMHAGTHTALLCDLVSEGQVEVKVVLAVKCGHGRHVAMESQTGQHCRPDTAGVEDGKGPGKARVKERN